MCDLSLPVLKAVPERTEPLDNLYVLLPSVNWVSGNVFYEYSRDLWVCSDQ